MPPRRITELRGLGPTSKKLLAQINIFDEEQLRAIGAVEAFARIRMTSEFGIAGTSQVLCIAVTADSNNVKLGGDVGFFEI